MLELVALAPEELEELIGTGVQLFRSSAHDLLMNCGTHFEPFLQFGREPLECFLPTVPPTAPPTTAPITTRASATNRKNTVLVIPSIFRGEPSGDEG